MELQLLQVITLGAVAVVAVIAAAVRDTLVDDFISAVKIEDMVHGTNHAAALPSKARIYFSPSPLDIDYYLLSNSEPINSPKYVVE
ncbi:MAG: hypothetical protein ACRBFS_20905 [Aureispira sp.]